MALTSCKTSCGLLLVLMVLTGIQGARIPSNCDHSKNKTHPEHENMVPLQLNPKLLTPVTAMTPLNNDSISPWTWNISTDPSLYPPVSEAKCLLKGCLDSKGQEDLNRESRPIFHQVLVLRRVHSSHGQGYHYRLEQRLVAVGCTCVQPFVQEQN